MPGEAILHDIFRRGGRHLKTLFRIGILIVVGLHLAGPLLPFSTQDLMFIPAILVLVTGFPMMSGGFRKATGIFLLLGSAMLAISGQPAAAWMAACASMTNIIAIVAVMQTFSMPIRLGDYNSAMHSWLGGRLKSRKGLFLFTTLTTHLLASLLNLGAVPVTVSLLENTIRRRIPEYERFFAAAMTRGYVLAALWSPGAVVLYLILQATGLSWARLFVPGFILGLVGIAMSYLMEKRKGGFLDEVPKKGLRPVEDSISPVASGMAQPGSYAGSREVSRASHVLIVAFAFVLVLMILETTRIGSSSGRIILAGVFVSLGWLALLSRRPGLAGVLKSYWSSGLMKAAEIGPFFVAMGIFSGALEKSGVMGFIAPIFQSASDSLGAGAVVFIGLVIVLSSLIGLHPFITIVLFGKILAHADLPIPVLTVALSLTVGAATSYMISPFAGMIMTVSRLLDAKTTDIAIRWNWRFCVLFFGVGMLFSFFWGALFG